MPRARRKAASPESVHEEELQVEDHGMDQEQADGLRPLQFNEAITWKAGKPIPISDLLRRLRVLHEELSSLDQEEADRNSLVSKAQELANTQLLQHKDKGVRAWTLLNIVEMFTLLAPDAPYKQTQLKQIFSLFVNDIMPALANPSDPYNQQHVAMLASLTEVKSIVLLTDIQGSDTLISNLFTNAFDVVSGNVRGAEGETLPKTVENHVTSMLCTLVDECAQMPKGVMDIVLAQFLRADPNTLRQNKDESESKETAVPVVPPAYGMARSLCNTCAEKMSKAVSQYFSSVLIDSSESFSSNTPKAKKGKKRTHDENEDESDNELLPPPDEGDLQEIEKAHRLLRELWRSAPGVVADVIPQIEAEITAENQHLRRIAVETVGDMAAGIGAAGLAASPPMDPAAYPSQSMDDFVPAPVVKNVLTEPNAPHAFSSVHAHAYQAFLNRSHDKAASVRAALALAIGRIIATSGGGKGLDQDEESTYLRHLARMLQDSDEKVRLASIQAVALMSFETIVQRIAPHGAIADEGSVLFILAARIKDTKRGVRAAAIELFGRLWGVAAAAITEGNEQMSRMFGSIPSKIFMAVYINNQEINASVYKVLYESLLPVRYPPIKKSVPSDSQRVKDSQNDGSDQATEPDVLRVERILTLVNGLESKAKTVFFMIQQRQAVNARVLDGFLRACEEWQGGNNSTNKKDCEAMLERCIDALSKLCPNPMSASEHLKRFAKLHDRRCYQLIRFCLDTKSDYKKVANAQKELVKKLQESPGQAGTVIDTVLPLTRLSSVFVYNKSHVPAVVSISSSNAHNLGQAAHEVLKDISMRSPDVFKAHVSELCETLMKQAPTAIRPNESAAADTLKACAGFASRFPEDMPRSDRKLYQAMVAFALHGSPPAAAKHAVTVIVASAEKKEMYIRDVVENCVNGFEVGGEGFLSKLAALSQLRLLATSETENETDSITDIAIAKVLTQKSTDIDPTQPQWSKEVDDDLAAKLWALKILVNGLRGRSLTDMDEEAKSRLVAAAKPVYKLLNTLIEREGELSKDEATPAYQKSRLRLAAGIQLLKLCGIPQYDRILGPSDFNRLSKLVQDPLPEVRSGFNQALKKYLGQGRLAPRFYALLFIYAFEPTKELKDSTATWLRARATSHAQQSDNVLEGVFPRFISLLAHHQDFSAAPEFLPEFVTYVVFYLQHVVTEQNLSLIYHLAQRIKSVADRVDPSKSENIYVLSDLADAVIRRYAEAQGWSLQLHPGKARLPSDIFEALPSHDTAQKISEKNYLPEEVADNMEELVKDCLKPRSKKRKPENKVTGSNKKPRQIGEKAMLNKKAGTRKTSRRDRTPKRANSEDVPSSDRRRSTRTSSAKNYVENDDSEDDAEMEDWNEEDEKENMEVDAVEGANLPSSTPPTSHSPNQAPRKTPKKEPVKARKTRAVGSQRPNKAVGARQMPSRMGKPTAAKSTKEKDIYDVEDDSA